MNPKIPSWFVVLLGWTGALVSFSNWACADQDARRDPKKELKKDSKKDSSKPFQIVQSNSSFSVYLGSSAFSYRENLYPNFSEIGLTAKVNYRYLLGPRGWDFGVNAFGTVLPLTSNQSGVNTRFFGLNLRIGYGTRLLREPWKLSVMVGGYYTTMLVSGAPFGFNDLKGPQIYPVLRYITKSGEIVTTSFKFSPLGSVFSLQDRELALGAAWTWLSESGNPKTVSFDFSDLRFSNQGTSAVLNTATLSFSYGF